MTHTVCLVGNPNTGKSTIFNLLTGMRQHTGNWSGKTVGSTTGRFICNGDEFDIIDLPGIYSLNALSEDERYAVDYLKSGKADLALIVLDATCLERNLILALQVLGTVKKAIICVNLMDEAERKNIKIDLGKLSELTGAEVIGTSAGRSIGIAELKRAIYLGGNNVKGTDKTAEEIYKQAVVYGCDIDNCIDRRIDRIVMSRLWGVPIMLALLGLIFYITIVGANIPSSALSGAFARCEDKLWELSAPLPYFWRGLLIKGMFKTLGWVVSVMLPPMAIFFPLFTLLEDIGYLPRIAFVLDRLFQRAGAHGKMVLTICMGFGCNAVGVTAARIIESPRERLIAILTNSFIPCNGRFPSIIVLAAFLCGGNFEVTLVVLGVIVISVLLSLAASLILSETLLKGVPSAFVLELPPYRKPQILSILYTSLTDRIMFVLGRSVAVAAPAGAVIWLMQNVFVGGESLIDIAVGLLEYPAAIIGLDGEMLTAFVLGMPANEIVLPLAVMCYLGEGLTQAENTGEIISLFTANGWSIRTVICALIFTVCHFPCTTTLLTVKKETGSLKQTAAAFALPLVTGSLLCALVNIVYKCIGF